MAKKKTPIKVEFHSKGNEVILITEDVANKLQYATFLNGQRLFENVSIKKIK